MPSHKHQESKTSTSSPSFKSEDKYKRKYYRLKAQQKELEQAFAAMMEKTKELEEANSQLKKALAKEKKSKKTSTTPAASTDDEPDISSSSTDVSSDEESSTDSMDSASDMEEEVKEHHPSSKRGKKPCGPSTGPSHKRNEGRKKRTFNRQEPEHQHQHQHPHEPQKPRERPKCKFWNGTPGSCRQGAKCKFAHPGRCKHNGPKPGPGTKRGNSDGKPVGRGRQQKKKRPAANGGEDKRRSHSC